MSTRVTQVILLVLILLSASLNVLQFKGFASREDQWDKSFVLDSLLRLSLSRSTLTDSDNSLSTKSLQRLHGEVLMDLNRVRPNIGELGIPHQQRYQEILADLNKLRISRPGLFSRDNVVMDDSMYSRYITWITDGHSPE
jgi:hypothetical protein